MVNERAVPRISLRLSVKFQYETVQLPSCFGCAFRPGQERRLNADWVEDALNLAQPGLLLLQCFVGFSVLLVSHSDLAESLQFWSPLFSRHRCSDWLISSRDS